MRTVIVNTMGRDYNQRDVFFRAFQDSDIHWVTAELDQIGQCAGHLASVFQQMSVRRDYQLIVLVDVNCFAHAKYEAVRQWLYSLITAYVNYHLIAPLSRAKALPAGVNLVFLCREHRDEMVFAEDPTMELLNIRSLRLTDPFEGATLGIQYAPKSQPARNMDLSDMFATALRQFEQSPWMRDRRNQTAQDKTLAQGEEHGEDLLGIPIEDVSDSEHAWEDCCKVLVENLNQRISELQTYVIPENFNQVIEPQQVEFRPEFLEQTAVTANLQINLANLVSKISKMDDGIQQVDLNDFRPYSREELGDLIMRARARIQKILEVSPGPKYYPLDAPDGQSEIASLRSGMRQELREKAGSLMGVEEAILEDEGRPVPSTLNAGSELRAAIIRIKKARERFWKVFQELRSNYKRDRVLEEQKQILDICAESYQKWRPAIRHWRAVMNAPELDKRPVLDQADTEKTLYQVQARSIAGTLIRLHDYEDVREEADGIRARFRQTAQLWTPIAVESDMKRFLKFALVLAIAAVLLMLLPYVLIAAGTTGSEIPEALLFLLTGVGMGIVYFGGVLWWANKLCRKIRQLVRELRALLDSSRVRRKESVLQVLNTYGKLLPDCLVQRVRSDILHEIDGRNEIIEHRWKLHRGYLDSAVRELDDLRTALRLPANHEEFKDALPKLDYSKAPYDESNQNVYLLFDRREERR